MLSVLKTSSSSKVVRSFFTKFGEDQLFLISDNRLRHLEMGFSGLDKTGISFTLSRDGVKSTILESIALSKIKR